MRRILWCCLAVAVFTGFLVYIIRCAIESAPITGWWPGISCGCIALGFLGLWVTRLVLAIRNRSEADRDGVSVPKQEINS
jgi:hypothetical protein